MTKLPQLTGRRVTAVLSKIGFEVIRVKGSHHFLRHPDGRSTVVPVHSGETIGPGLMAKILDDCEIADAKNSALSCSCRDVRVRLLDFLEPADSLSNKMLLREDHMVLPDRDLIVAGRFFAFVQHVLDGGQTS